MTMQNVVQISAFKYNNYVFCISFHYLQQVTYNKTKSESALRVIFSTSFGGHINDPGKCSRFYVTFDDLECTNPMGIERLSFSNHEGSMRRSNNSTCL